MAPPPREFIFIILQIMYKYNMYESAQNLEQESTVYFNLETFKVMIINGLWEKVHKYLSSFIHPGDHSYNSKMIFWKIGREKYLEALDEKDQAKALSVFDKDLKPWLTSESSRELVELITLDDFRKKDKYAKYGDTPTRRMQLVVELVEMLKEHPIIKDKLSFPRMDQSRLETLLSQRSAADVINSVNRQRLMFNNAAPNPTAVGSLLVDANERPSRNPHQSGDAQMRPRAPYRNNQNQGAGPSFAQNSSGPSSNPLNARRPRNSRG